MSDELTKYKEYVIASLRALTPVFAKASIGDFSEKVNIPEGDDEFIELYVGVEIMLEVIRGQLGELQSLNKSLSEKVEELQFTQNLVQQEKVFDEAMLQSIGEGVVVTDKDFKITLVNLQAQLMLGFTEDEMVSKSVFEALTVTDEKGNMVPQDKRAPSIAINQKKKATASYYYLRQDTKPLPVSVTASPVMLGGIPVGVIIVFRDMSKEKQVEEMKNEFISIAAHQLRTPLSITRWNIELLHKNDSGNISKSAAEKIDAIYKSNQKMIALVNDMLSVSRIDQGRVEHAIEDVDIISSIKEVMDEIRILADTKMVEIKFVKPEPSTLLVKADKRKLKDVISNLINNAIKFNTPLGKVEISLKTDEKWVLLEVSDSGIGVPATEVQNVFDKFFRASNAVLGQTPGTGLGLFLVKSYVTAWDGEVWFESPAAEAFRDKIGNTDNPGASFYIKLPKV